MVTYKSSAGLGMVSIEEKEKKFCFPKGIFKLYKNTDKKIWIGNTFNTHRREMKFQKGIGNDKINPFRRGKKMKDLDSKLDELINEIARLPKDWHLAGMMYPSLLRTIAKYCSDMEISYSMETGSGVSTILFSHISADHKVFAVEHGNGSITNVKKSPLFNAKTVEFIEGPSQITLPQYKFERKLQLALIDGPHGYPFPDLEYYYIYPNLETNALLIVDDIQIPMINNMFRFIEADEMFELLEVVGNTAFFRRTDAAAFPPTTDGWWRQNYNKIPLNLNDNIQKKV